MRFTLQPRLLLIQCAILAAFALMPLWYRLPARPAIFAPLYLSRFSLLLPLLLAVGAWLVAGLPGFAALRRWRRVWALALLSLAGWGLLSTQWAFIRFRDPATGETAALQLAAAALFAVVVACAAPPPRIITAVLALGLLPNALVTIAQAANQGALGLTAVGEFPFHATWEGVSILRAGDLIYVRPYGLMPHPNATAGMLMIGLLAAGAWLFHPRAAIRVGAAGLCALGLAALLLTFSRAAWLGLAAGGLVMLMGSWRSLFGESATITGLGKRMRTGIAIPPALSGVVDAGAAGNAGVVPTHVSHHDGVASRRGLYATLALALVLALVVGGWFVAQYRPFLAARVGEGQESLELRSVSDRLVFTDFALRSIRERPIFGVGIGNFPWRSSYYIAETFYDLRGDNVHHVFLSAWAELGTIGLALLLIALGCGVIGALKTQAGEQRSIYRVGLLAVVAALAVVGLFDHYPWTMLHFQAAWWGCLAGALHDGGRIVYNHLS